jgi:hypothetical protein
MLIASATPHAAHRCYRFIISANSESAVVSSLRARVSDVDTDPATVIGIFNPDIDPSVAGTVLDFAGINIARDIADRQADTMAAGDEYVGMVLANA